MRPPLVLLAISVLMAVMSGCGILGDGDAGLDDIRAYVHVEPVRQGRLDRTLRLTGTVEAGRTLDLIPDIAGEVVSLPVKVGQWVAKGQTLARIDLELALLQKKQADSAVRLAELAHGTAEREFARAEILHQSGTLTDQQFEQAQAGLEMALAQVSQAQAAKGMARMQVDGGVITAPFNGRISYVGSEEGQMFSPMAINPMGPRGLIGIVDLDIIKIDLQVSDRDVVRLIEGMPVKIKVDAVADLLSEEGLVGKVDSVGIAADAMSRTFQVRVVAANPEHVVRAGTHAKVYLVLERVEDVLFVPEEAVLENSDGEPYVVTADGGVAHRVPIETGLRGDDGVEIKGEVARDVQVIVRGHFGLVDGAKIEVVQ